MKLYALGPQNSYSDLVAQNIDLAAEKKVLYLDSFEEIVSKVATEEGAAGLVVVENSITSSIHPTIDQLFAKRVKIIAEAVLNVRLHLIGQKGATLDNIEQAYSKDVALQQVSEFLETHNITANPVSSTAEGMNYVKESSENAAVGGKQMADEVSEILAENIGNEKFNKTRFVVVTQPSYQYEVAEVNKLTVILSLPHKSGSLASLLAVIAEKGGNLTKIESRPIPGTDWEYRFWLDIEFTPENLDSIKNGIEQNSLDYNYLGFYRKGDTIES